MESIELNSTNFWAYLPLDIAAFSWAYGGAMGDPGGVDIVTASGKWFYFNWAFGDLNMTQVDEILPIISKCQLPIMGETDKVPAGWRHIYLGVGNNLLVRTEYSDLLLNSWEQFAKTKEGEGCILYNVWLKLMFEIVTSQSHSNVKVAVAEQIKTELSPEQILIDDLLSVVSRIDIPGVGIEFSWGNFFTNYESELCKKAGEYMKANFFKRLFLHPFRTVRLCWLDIMPERADDYGICAPKGKAWYLLMGFTRRGKYWCANAIRFNRQGPEDVLVPWADVPDSVLREALSLYKLYEDRKHNTL